MSEIFGNPDALVALSSQLRRSISGVNAATELAHTQGLSGWGDDTRQAAEVVSMELRAQLTAIRETLAGLLQRVDLDEQNLRGVLGIEERLGDL